jgi:hypothetical protein
MSLCTGAIGCPCQFTNQVLVDAMKQRTKEEGDLHSYPRKPKYIVHYTDDWYCSSKDCGHPISCHPSGEDPVRLLQYRDEIFASKTHITPRTLDDEFRRGVYSCCLCGLCHHSLRGDANPKITKAHIAKTSTNQWGIDVDSIRNFIPLCGTKDEKGTCHEAFDKGNLSFVQDPDSSERFWVPVLSNRADHQFLDRVCSVERVCIPTNPNHTLLHGFAETIITMLLKTEQEAQQDKIRRMNDWAAKITPPKTQQKRARELEGVQQRRKKEFAGSKTYCACGNPSESVLNDEALCASCLSERNRGMKELLEQRASEKARNRNDTTKP